MTQLSNRTDSQTSKGNWRWFALASAALFIALALQLAFHLTRTSVTIDEPPHILAGYRHLQCGDFGINPEHPPLLKMIAAVPLLSRQLNHPPWECGSKVTTKFESFTYGASFLVENDLDRIVVTARSGAAIVTLLFAVMLFVAAWQMFGRWQAVTALAVFAFEPNLIAHGSLVTTDMAISATAFAAAYALFRFASVPSWSNFVVGGIALGLMLSAKHSAAIILPILLVTFLFDAILSPTNSSSRVRTVLHRLTAFAGMCLIAWMVLWAFYGFRYYSIPSATSDTILVADYIKENGRPEVVTSLPARVTDFISKTRIFPESYVLGMADVISWGSRNTWLFGKNYVTGQWFYFPVALAVKSSLALLLLLPLGLLLPFIAPEKRRQAIFLLIPPLAFFGVALTSSFTTGVRHILPIYGFLIVVSAAGAVWLARKAAVLKIFVVALLVYSAAATVRTAPRYLAFANDLWGGTGNTHRIFNDSNTDTGQSIKLMNEYIRREGVTDCWTAAFVHPEIIEHIQPCRPMPSGLRILLSRRLLDPVPPVIEGTVFVSVNELPPRGAGEYVPMTTSEPLALIGGNILVFRGRFEVPVAAAISHVHRSGALLRAGKTDEAIEEARRAVQLAPEDPRTRLALGLAFSRQGQTGAAISELEMSAELAATQPVFRNTEVRARQELTKLK